MASDDLLTERLLRVIDEGRRTATYKLALLMALIDAAAAGQDDVEVSTRTLATHVLEIYYPQTRTYVSNGGTEIQLRQIAAKGSPPLRAALELRRRSEAAGCRSLFETKRSLPGEYAKAVQAVEDTFVRYPIPLLQVVGTRSLPFLYEVDWPEGTSVSTLRREGRDRIRFLEGVPGRLVVLGPLLRPLLEVHWIRDVARWSGVATEDDRLRAHLFGTGRMVFPVALRRGLAELQAGACFYCNRRLTQPGQVDHFLAWSRWPNDAVQNLVLADHCNADKSDHLAAPVHVDRWARRFHDHSGALQALALAARWTSDPERSGALVRSTYRHLVPGVPLWIGAKDFVEASGSIEVLV